MPTSPDAIETRPLNVNKRKLRMFVQLPLVGVCTARANGCICRGQQRRRSVNNAPCAGRRTSTRDCENDATPYDDQLGFGSEIERYAAL